jgi:hypothetical protein
MPRTPVGLDKNPAPNFTWQLTVAHGSLNWLPVLFGFVCGPNKGVTKQAGLRRLFRAALGENTTK